MPPKKDKSTVLPCYVKASDLPTSDGAIYGLEIKRSMETVLGKDCKIECIQKCNGVWRLVLWTKQDRNTLLQTGLSLRGHSIPVSNESPYSYKGKETVMLYISNVYYSIADEEVSKSLRNLGLILCGEIKWEQYRDEDRHLLDTKTGRRYVRISEPTKTLPDYVRIADTINGYISYYGQKQAEGAFKSDALSKLNYTKDSSKKAAIAAASNFQNPSNTASNSGGEEKTTVVTGPVDGTGSGEENLTHLSNGTTGSSSGIEDVSGNVGDDNVVVTPPVAEVINSRACTEVGLVTTNPFSALLSLEDQDEGSIPLSTQEGSPPTGIPVIALRQSRLPYRTVQEVRLRSDSYPKNRSSSPGLVSVKKRKELKNRSESLSKKQKKDQPKDQPSVLPFLCSMDCASTAGRTFECSNSKTPTSLKRFDQTGFCWFDLKYTK